MKEFLLDESLMCDSGKFRVISDLLDKHKEAGDRVLLFSQFTSLMDIAEVFLKSKNIRFLRLDGSTPVPERYDVVLRFIISWLSVTRWDSQPQALYSPTIYKNILRLKVKSDILYQKFTSE